MLAKRGARCEGRDLETKRVDARIRNTEKWSDNVISSKLTEADVKVIGATFGRQSGVWLDGRVLASVQEMNLEA